MLRLAARLSKVSTSPLVIPSSRRLSTSMVHLYAAKPATPAGKRKMAFNPKKGPQQAKAKKGGMTHLEFDDAVQSLSFEKTATNLGELEVPSLNYEQLDNLKSRVVKYVDSDERILSNLRSFKKFQHNELYRNPVTLVTENTTKINEDFVSKLDQSSSKENRICLTGTRGVGKSTLLSQTKALALEKFNKDVILLHIDAAENIVNGTSDYIFNTKLDKYQQPMFTKRWIYKLREANEHILKKLKLSSDITFTYKRIEHNLKKDTNTLFDLLKSNHDFGKVGQTTAFQFFLNELIHHSKTVPILLSIDNINAILDFPVSKYKKPDFTPIHISEFELGDFILKFLSGEQSFAKGGVIVAKTGMIGAHQKTMDVGLNIEEYDPYAKQRFFDLDIANSLKKNNGVKSFGVENFTKQETKDLLQFWRKAGTLQVKEFYTKDVFVTSEELVQEKANQAQDQDAVEFNPEEQFERIVNNQYAISSGNPHYLLRATTLSY
ncbi:mitochondrial ribosomal death-associated protein 3-domain-containing protein [Scheffersomyces coipomensis]|uniref:mitochondrial ribosomal death-associated protein 3-domain-containing protein n=1 Tax=Scheffersomyces coipomensis TaxID=1788519 RepID=UPI00315DF716